MGLSSWVVIKLHLLPFIALQLPLIFIALSPDVSSENVSRQNEATIKPTRLFASYEKQRITTDVEDPSCFSAE